MNAIVFERVNHYYPAIPSDNVHILSEKDFVDCVYPNPDTLSYEPCYERHYFIDGEDRGVEAQIRLANWRGERYTTVVLTLENIDEHIANFEEKVGFIKETLEKCNFPRIPVVYWDKREYWMEELEFFTMVVNTLREIKEAL